MKKYFTDLTGSSASQQSKTQKAVKQWNSDLDNHNRRQLKADAKKKDKEKKTAELVSKTLAKKQEAEEQKAEPLKSKNV